VTTHWLVKTNQTIVDGSRYFPRANLTPLGVSATLPPGHALHPGVAHLPRTTPKRSRLVKGSHRCASSCLFARISADSPVLEPPNFDVKSEDVMFARPLPPLPPLPPPGLLTPPILIRLRVVVGSWEGIAARLENKTRWGARE
jgi:hypothetical protein